MSDMKNIKKIMTGYLRTVTFSIVIVLLVFMLIAQVLNTQRQAQQEAAERFEQIHQILAENETDFAAVEEDLKQNDLRSAQAVAYVLEDRPELLDSVEQLQEIAEILHVDEIWIFDETGAIIAGTDADYFGLTFDTGKQMAFFKPMLEDKSLQLCQDIMPRTADGKPFRYSALWNEDGTYIVQVGTSAESALRALERYDLSYIFSLLRVNSESELYAIDQENGDIVGSTVSENIGRNLTDIGLELETVQAKKSGFHAQVSGELSYCVFSTEGENLIGRIISCKELYREILPKALDLTLILVISAWILTYAVTKCVDKLVIHNIQRLNEKLRAITEGNFEERVELQNSLEFSRLSDYINEMVGSLRDKVQEHERIFNIVAQHSNRILYAYDLASGTTRPWDEESRKKDILAHLYTGNYSDGELEKNQAVLPESVDDVRKFFADIHGGVPYGQLDVHIKLEDGQEKWYNFMYSSIFEGNRPVTALISIADVTEKHEIIRRADHDAMTGLLRRDAGEMKIRKLLAEDDEKGGILIVLDLDDLKGINDNLGHKAGDDAISGIAGILKGHFRQDDILIRAGGDEFIIFLPGASQSIETVEISMTSLLQKLSVVSVGENRERNIHCSAGCAAQIVDGEPADTYDALFRRADTALYHVKRNGKNSFAFYVPEMEQADYEFRSKQLLSMQSSKKFELAELQYLLDSIIRLYQLVLSVNISNNSYHLMEEVKDGVFSRAPEFGTLDDFVNLAARGVHREDLDRYMNTLSREALMQAYERGEEQVKCRFRFGDETGYRMVEGLASFYTNNNGDVCDFTMLRWAEQE